MKNNTNSLQRRSYDKYYMSYKWKSKILMLQLTINHFLINPWQKQEAVEKLVKMSRNDDYTTGNLLDYLYHQSYHKPIGIDSSSNTNSSAHQKMNFTGKLEEDDNATMLFTTEK